MTARKTKDKTPSFEVRLAELEELTRRLESGELPLEAALGAYEQGVAISRQLLLMLDAAEKRIRVLSGEDEGGAPGEAPFEAGDQ
jgi:exodeoxyribonuclease VII small subunit